MFDANGDRPGFTSVIYNFNPVSDTPATTSETVWVAGTWLSDPVSGEFSETQYNMRPITGSSDIPGYFSYPPINFYNERA